VVEMAKARIVSKEDREELCKLFQKALVWYLSEKEKKKYWNLVRRIRNGDRAAVEKREAFEGSPPRSASLGATARTAPAAPPNGKISAIGWDADGRRAKA
jgi:hypothetical protein